MVMEDLRRFQFRKEYPAYGGGRGRGGVGGGADMQNNRFPPHQKDDPCKESLIDMVKHQLCQLNQTLAALEGARPEQPNLNSIRSKTARYSPMYSQDMSHGRVIPREHDRLTPPNHMDMPPLVPIGRDDDRFMRNVLTPPRSISNSSSSPATPSPRREDDFLPQPSILYPVDDRKTEKKSNNKFTKRCAVCGDHAPEHIHYGSITCFSCRAFFRRSVPKAHLYICPGGRSCEIGIGTRKNCQYCRYKACLNAGMKPSWVLTENEKKERMEKKRQNAAKRLAEAKSEDDNDVDFQVVDDIIKIQEETTKSCVFSKAVLDSLSVCSKNIEATLPRWASFDFFAVQYSRVARFSMAIKEFSQLPPEIQRQVLQVNMEPMTNVRLSQTFKTRSCMDKTTPQHQFREMNGPVEDDLSIGQRAITIEQIFTKDWANGEEHYSNFTKVMTSLEKLVGNDAKVTVLLQLVNLFNSSGEQLKDVGEDNRRAMEEAQEKYFNILLSYIKFKDGGGKLHIEAAPIIKMLQVMSDLRLLSEKSKSME